jgi:hypothetical protein
VSTTEYSIETMPRPQSLYPRGYGNKWLVPASRSPCAAWSEVVQV